MTESHSMQHSRIDNEAIIVTTRTSSVFPHPVCLIMQNRGAGSMNCGDYWNKIACNDVDIRC
jgi:hypothetical protein